MHKQWIGCLASNYAPGRAGFKPAAVVIHRTGGSLQDMDARFTKAPSFSSSHYAVGLGGEVHQYVDESDTAFHAGVMINPTWKLLKSGSNPNFYTIAVEAAGVAGDPLTDSQYQAAAALIAEILRSGILPPTPIMSSCTVRLGPDAFVQGTHSIETPCWRK